MQIAPRIFFDHSRHKLQVRDLKATLDVLAFEGQERLSEPFLYTIEFTSSDLDLGAQQLLGQDARFSLHAPPVKPLPGLSLPEVKPLRTLFGVVSAFKRLSASVDEARYEITLQPRLALLDRGRQSRIYQQQSVPEIVESILRSRHGFRGQDFFFRLVREYPTREQVMQYNESDLMFISRLLADVGIWYRFTSDERLRIDVVEFCDDQRGYQFDVRLPQHPPAGLSSSDRVRQRRRLGWSAPRVAYVMVLGLALLWGAGLLLSFVSNRVQIAQLHSSLAALQPSGQGDEQTARAQRIGP